MPQPPQQPAPLLFLTLITLCLLFSLFPEGGDYPNQAFILSDLAAQRLAGYRDALNQLNISHWGDFAPRTPAADDASEGEGYMNMTGFREVDGFAWEDLGMFRSKGLELSRYALPSTQEQTPWDAAHGESVWANASGALHGEWAWRAGSVTRNYESYNLSNAVPEINWIADRTDWARNITGSSGRIVLRLEGNRTVENYELSSGEDEPSQEIPVRNIRGFATVEDTTGSGLSWEMGMYGIHWPRHGVVLLTTTSEKFAGIFGLPHLTSSADFFRSSQMLLNQSLARDIVKKEESKFTDQRMPWSSDLENPTYSLFPSPHCEYIMYAQVLPPTGQDLDIGQFPDPDNKANAIHEIESELEFPIGAPIGNIPKLQISTVIWSPDCAFFLESKGPPDFPQAEGNHLIGMKAEVHIYQIKLWVLGYALVMFSQAMLFKNQMRESSTPSTIGRISFGTASIMLIMDTMTFAASATWTASATSTFLATMVLMFASFLAMFLGGSFLSHIHEVQIPENRRNAEQEQQQAERARSGAAAATATNPATSVSILPGPVTASRRGQTPVQPVIVPSDQDVAAEIAEAAAAVPRPNIPPPAAGRVQPLQRPVQPLQAIIMRYMLLILCVGFLGISSLSWYASLRSLFLNTCAFCYLSLWIPQIYRNIMRNCRRALTWEFVIGQSFLRLLPVAYFWVKADNVFFARPDRRAFLVLLAWVWLQLFILAAQDVVGPRFGIPTSWTPEAWDYHPVLREDNIEAGGLPIGLVAEDNPGLERADSTEERDRKRSTRYAIDCAICREALEVSVVKAGEEDMSVTGAFARRSYMVTPCRHILHTACLEGWMRYRLQCPICRTELPPL